MTSWSTMIEGGFRFVDELVLERSCPKAADLEPLIMLYAGDPKGGRNCPID